MGLVEADDMVALDCEVIEGVESVDESAITGESAPVVRITGESRVHVLELNIALDVLKKG